jgi:hypothetical protein
MGILVSPRTSSPSLALRSSFLLLLLTNRNERELLLIQVLIHDPEHDSGDSSENRWNTKDPGDD